MPDSYRKWAQGDEWQPSAAQLNSWTDAARLAAQAQRGVPTPTDQVPGHALYVRVCNTTGDRLPALAVVNLSAPLVVPALDTDRFEQQLTLSLVVPAAPLTRFAILSRSLGEDEVGIGVAQVSGVFPCRITGSGDLARAINGDVEKLQAGTEGYPLLWSEAGTGERLAVIQMLVVQGCQTLYTLGVEGNPDGGSFTLYCSIPSISGTLYSVTINWDDTAAEVAASITSVTSATAFSVGGGPLPLNDLLISFDDQQAVVYVIHSANALDQNGSIVPYPYVRTCCVPSA